jgi:hypothetical protein
VSKVRRRTYRPGVYGVSYGGVSRPVTTVPVEPGTRPRNGLPVTVPYQYRGSEHDAGAPRPELPRGSAARPVPERTWLTRHEIAMCPPCFEDLCEACQGGECKCACQDVRTTAQALTENYERGQS